MRIFFLGTNGWFSTCTGSTICTAIALRNRLIVLDAGDGFARLAPLMSRLGVSRADVFLSHLHIDHVSGLHTLPRLARGARIRIFAHKSCLPALRRLVARPYTASPSEQPARVSLHPLRTGENRLPYKVRVLLLDHADPCFGFRFSLEGKEIAYCTDTGPCRNFGRLARGADALVAECALLPGSPPTPGWPHLSPQMAAREAAAAGAARLMLTHFDASRYGSPAMRASAQAAARRIFPRTLCARDRMVLKI